MAVMVLAFFFLGSSSSVFVHAVLRCGSVCLEAGFYVRQFFYRGKIELGPRRSLRGTEPTRLKRNDVITLSIVTRRQRAIGITVQ